LTVVCTQNAQNVFDADSGRSSTLWYRIKGGWWMSSVYLLVDDPDAVPAC